MNRRTAIFPIDSLPEDTAPETDEGGNVTAAYVHLGSGYARLECIDQHTAVNASTLQGPLEDHINQFDLVSAV